MTHSHDGFPPSLSHSPASSILFSGSISQISCLCPSPCFRPCLQGTRESRHSWALGAPELGKGRPRERAWHTHGQLKAGGRARVETPAPSSWAEGLANKFIIHSLSKLWWKALCPVLGQAVSQSAADTGPALADLPTWMGQQTSQQKMAVQTDAFHQGVNPRGLR